MRWGAETNLSLSKKQSEEIKSRLTTEQKLTLLIKYFEKHDNAKLYSDLRLAKIDAQQGAQMVLVNITEDFNAPQFQDGPEVGVMRANNEGALLFTIGPGGMKAAVVMVASLVKFPRVGGPGHFASSRQIKPLAIGDSDISVRQPVTNRRGVVRNSTDC